MDMLDPALVPTTALAIGFGAVLLLFGRKVFWLALGIAGGVLGFWVADTYVAGATQEIKLAIAVVLAIAGVVAAIVVQKVAVVVGGFLIGGMAAVEVGNYLEADLNSGWWLALILVAGGLGAFYGSILFESALIVFTAWVGAWMIVSEVGLLPPGIYIAFVILLVVGCTVQSRLGKRGLRLSERSD